MVTGPVTGCDEPQARVARRAHGWTLVELAVVLGVAALLLASVGPMGVAWVDNAKSLNARATLQTGFSAARALALQNPGGITLNGPAAILCLAGSGSVRVYVGGSCPGSGAAVWQGSMPSGTQLTIGGVLWPPCISLNNRGQPMAGASGCSTNLQFTLTVGQANVANTTLY
ncbi:MAG: type II secretion system protein [Pseudomonadota bacterium]